MYGVSERGSLLGIKKDIRIPSKFRVFNFGVWIFPNTIRDAALSSPNDYIAHTIVSRDRRMPTTVCYAGCFSNGKWFDAK